MDYEKKYKEAMERAKQGCPMDEVFPELVESEDERIRREIMEYLTITREKDLVAHPERQRWIAYLKKQKLISDSLKAAGIDIRQDGGIERHTIPYLEKQKKQEELPLMGGDVDLYFDEWNQQQQNPTKRQCFEEGVRYAKRLQKEQKPADVSEKIEELCSKYPLNKRGVSEQELSAYHQGLTFGATRIAEYLGAQKPAEWSEEDSRILYNVIAYVGYAAGQIGVRNDLFKEANDWLKSLPEKFNLQPKQEWGEEEKKVLDSIIDDYEKTAKSFCGYDGKIMLLKAIRDGEYGLSKQEWGEEDEKKLSAVISLMKSSRAVDPFYDKMCLKRWLEFLPKRFYLHPKQVWSEGDINRHYYLCKLLRETWDKVDKGSCIDDAITWLEKLPEQIYPHSWKPSEEQMEVMEYYIHTLICNRNKEVLFGLYNDLKKL